MFGVGKKKDEDDVSKNQQPDMKFGRDFEKPGDLMDFPLKKEISQEPMPEAPMPQKSQPLPQPQAQPVAPPAANTEPASISQTPDPVGNLELPPLPEALEHPSASETNVSEAKPAEKKEEPPKNIHISQMPPSGVPGPFTRAKGPVFISVKRYKEVMYSLNSLKTNANQLRQIIENLKHNRDTGTDLLSTTADNLADLEQDIEKVNASIKA